VPTILRISLLLGFLALGSCHKGPEKFENAIVIAIKFDEGPTSAYFVENPDILFRLSSKIGCQDCENAYRDVLLEDGGAPYICSYRMTVSGVFFPQNLPKDLLPPRPPGTIEIGKVVKRPKILECKADSSDLIHK
jgi:hypothetical protein